MKIIFLDIDGVLNTSQTFINCHKLFKRDGIRGLEIDEFRIKLLKKVVEETNAKIVLSSSWRIFYKKIDNEIIPIHEKTKKLNNLLRKYQLEIFDITPFANSRRREDEISLYLLENNIDSFVIFDDDSYDLTNFVDKELVKTNWEPKKDDYTSGLCEKHIERAIKILKKRKESNN